MEQTELALKWLSANARRYFSQLSLSISSIVFSIRSLGKNGKWLTSLSIKVFSILPTVFFYVANYGTLCKQTAGFRAIEGYSINISLFLLE